MANGLNNRTRLLAVMDILQSKSDEDKGLSLSDITSELKRYATDREFNVTVNALKEDIASLQDSGIQIREEKSLGAPTQYKWVNRNFDIYELRMMIDAVASAHGLTVEDSEVLIDKIKSLASENQAKKLGSHLFVQEHVKTKASVVKFYIGDIHEAILNRQKITFQYRKYNTNKQFELHRNGYIYTVRPFALVWSQDNYYLIGFQEEVDLLKTFRVDRLYRVTLTSECFPDPEFNVAQYVNQTFNMYPGEIQTVRIKFQNSLINVVMDRFGEKVSLYSEDDKTFTVVIQAAVSEGLLRWLLTWGADAQVLSPPALVERLKNEARRMIEVYK